MKKTEQCYTNRELSWLQFNERVLNEAGNPRVPLAERLTFASIYQTNLDEFFMVRVGTLMMQMNAKEKVRENKTGMTSEEQVREILNQVCVLEKKKAKIYEQLMGELEPKGIRIINFNKLSNEEGRFLEQYFDAHIAPFLSPMIIGKQQPFPFLANKQLYAIVLLTTGKGKKKTGIVPCSNSVFKRLIEIPTRPGCFMLSEELILHFISKLYPKYYIREKSIMRVTRNADIDAHDLYDEDMDYRNMMEQLIKKRVRLDPVRVELSRKINDKATTELSNFLEIGTSHIINVKTPLDLSFVFELQNYLRDRSELFYEKRTPRDTPELSLKESILDQVEKKDVLLSYPFESMKPFIKMLNDAAEDPDVVSIKMTLYRVADRSKIIDALIEAAENGKEVVVLVELRARFDEANNIEMSHRLEDAGCQILYGLGDYKVHSKLCLITKKTPTGFAYITQIGTGNYNEKTAKLYTDYSLMTANQSIGEDAAVFFKNMSIGNLDGTYKNLIVSPTSLKQKILALMDEEIQKGEQGRIVMKMNSVTDMDFIRKVAEASRAGVKVDLIVRGICCILPGIAQETENLTVTSIVGRYLEHPRVFVFGTGAEQKVYIGSADMMTRNTEKRVEVACPILNEEIKKRLVRNLHVMLADNVKARVMTSDGTYRKKKVEGKAINSQEIFMKEALMAKRVEKKPQKQTFLQKMRRLFQKE